VSRGVSPPGVERLFLCRHPERSEGSLSFLSRRHYPQRVTAAKPPKSRQIVMSSPKLAKPAPIQHIRVAYKLPSNRYTGYIDKKDPQDILGIFLFNPVTLLFTDICL
jgi:hypothetical protein